MVHSTPSRRRVLTALAGTVSLGGGCLGRVVDPATVRLTGVRIHNWVEAASTITLELRREGSLVLEERVSLAPLRDPGSVVSFPAEWPVDPAQYRLRVTTADGAVTLDGRSPGVTTAGTVVRFSTWTSRAAVRTERPTQIRHGRSKHTCRK